jgi:hypothetical protein
LYVAMEGRSLIKTQSLFNAPIATYLGIQGSHDANQTLTLLGADGTGIAGAAIAMTKVTATGALSIQNLVTSSTGIVPWSTGVTSGDRVYLTFKGNSKYSPAQAGLRIQ